MTFTPTFSAMERYSDNVSLVSTGRESSFITEIRPGFKLSSKGGRGEYSVDYSLQSLLYSHDSKENALNNQLAATLRTEILEDHFFLDGSANISQVNTDLTKSTGTGNFNTTGNLSETKTVSLTPSWKSRFGDKAKLDARWMVSYSDSDNAAISGASASNLSVTLSSGPHFQRTPWGLNFQQQNSDGDANASHFSSLSGNIGYAVTPKVTLNLTVGRDSNNGTTNAYSQTSGSFWSVGGSWNPSPRTSLGANVGKRYNGDSYGLSFNHRTRQTVWDLRYNEQVTDTFAQILQAIAYDVYLCDNLLIFVPSGSGSPDPAVCLPLIFNLPVLTSQLQSGFTLNKTLSGTVSYKTGKSTFALNLSRTQIDLLATATNDETRAVTGSWNYKLTPRMTSTLSLSSTSAQAAGSKSDDWSMAWSLSRQLAKQATGTLEARRVKRSDDSTNGGYSENSVSARLSMSF
ncbi:MAG TPA: TIGR03016 family PEP-CTERM system-associated outer membrane protein [Thiobacillaceae bacterium]|nr:TIGR03016 family PEP-CTERM system-associated outer membrane protein [Thiobacillaceae bacterium]HNH88114.1 TIGR03016 family PEP-CTERM system-associated outer membrane protein [Thiobacillaceae bacterium]